MPSDAPQQRPTICLNMIVRDEAHIVCEALDSAAPHIDRWVIVDTGSTDETVATIERRMAEHGIPGEIHHRPWRDFGTNRTEALQLADGQADYLWVLDADDVVDGDLDLTALTADSYLLRYRVGHSFWRRQIFRGGMPWRYEGVLHEYPVCDAPATEARLEGRYEMLGRKLGARSADPRKYERDAELLRTVLEREPDDHRALFYLGQSLADAGDDEGALEAYTRRAALGGWDEEQCLALIRRADLLERLGRPWAASLDALLEAFDARPTRAEPLARIARHYREAGRFTLGYEFARRASALPYPVDDNLFVDASVYEWRARDEQSVCAFHTGRYAEALDLGTALLDSTSLPAEERERVAGNRDSCVEHVREQRASHPVEVVAALGGAAASAAAAPDVTLTINAGGDRERVERTLDAFLNCCEDLERIARYVCLFPAADGHDVRSLVARYPFLEVVRTRPEAENPAETRNRLLDLVQTPFWLSLEDDWELFARGRLIERATRILAADETIAQVAFNRSYGVTLQDRHLVGGEVRTVDGLRYRVHEYLPPDGPEWERFRATLAPDVRTNVHWPHFTVQPSLLSVERLRRVGPFVAADDVEHEFGRRYVAAGLRTAFFDELTALRATTPAVPAGPPPAPPLLSRLAPGTRIGELDLEVDPPWPVVAAAVATDEHGPRLTVRTAVGDEAPRDYAVGLGPDLTVERLESVAAGSPLVGQHEVAVEGGTLRVENAGAGLSRMVRRADDGSERRSPVFSIAGAEDERAFGLTRSEDRLLLVFGVHSERLAIAVVEPAEIEHVLGWG